MTAPGEGRARPVSAPATGEACGVILAGGRGERFGTPKAFAVLPDGRTFLAACRDALGAAGCAPIVATLPPEAPLPDLTGVRLLPLPASGLEMFDSLAVALEAGLASGAWRTAIVLPVDHPLVDPATVLALRELRGPAAVPRFAGKRGHPVALSREVAARIARRLVPPGSTLRDVLHGAPLEDVEVEDPGVVANCNTPEALAAAWERRRERPGSA